MIILSYNPGHDGAFACLEGGQLVVSVESEKNSCYRYSPLAVPDVFSVFRKLNEPPDVLCRSCWWQNDAFLTEKRSVAGYHGVHNDGIIVGKRFLLGKTVEYFSSSLGNRSNQTLTGVP